MTAIVRVQGLGKVYRQGALAVHALRHVDLEVEQGDFVALVGPSGSGKTTLLNLIGGLDRPTEGSIWLGDQEITGLGKGALSRLRLHQIGFVFQEYNLIPVLSALENVEYVMLLQGVPEQERRRRSLALLKELGLEGLEQRRPRELSGGQQQRVAVARAMAAEPLIVLPDEPTANLDSAAGGALLDLMRKLNAEKGTTFIFSTHDPMVMQRARRIVRMQDGQIVEQVRQ